MIYYSIPPHSDEIYHYGVKGMRWGVRRYENKDGTLTPLGKRRLKAHDEYKKKEAKVRIEAQKILEQDKSLRRLFKDVDRTVHEDRYDADGPHPDFKREAHKRRIDTSMYEKAVKDADKYRYDNYGDINAAKKYLAIKNMTDEEYKDWNHRSNMSALKNTATVSAIVAALYGHHKYKKWMENNGGY